MTDLYERVASLYDQTPNVINPYPGGTAWCMAFSRGSHSGWDAAIKAVLDILEKGAERGGSDQQ